MRELYLAFAGVLFLCLYGHHTEFWELVSFAADSGRGRTCKTVKTHFIARSQSQLQNIYTKGSGGINSSYQGQNKQYLVRAASGQPLESKPGAYNPKSIGDSVKSALDAFYRFSRPHTVVGTVKFRLIFSLAMCC